MKDMITIQNLTKTYGKHRGVEDVTFSVREGEIFGFLGPNGAGKSTTIRSMLGLIKYDQGEIRINGLDSVKDREKILADIGYMPSEAWFYPGMKIREILKYSAAVRKVDCTDEAEKLCDRLQVDVKRKINELSLGNRKKVSIICAMQHRPKLFVFDEPTSGLDFDSMTQVAGLIRRLSNMGKVIFIVTHDFEFVCRTCSRVLHFDEGEMPDDVPVTMDALPKLRELFSVSDGKER